MAELKLEGPHTPLPPPVGPGPSRGLSGLQITGIVLGAMDRLHQAEVTLGPSGHARQSLTLNFD